MSLYILLNRMNYDITMIKYKNVRYKLGKYSYEKKM